MTGMKRSIELNDDLYSEYEELLLRRDQMNVEADSYLVAYTREFGDLIIKPEIFTAIDKNRSNTA